jgi:hypothetical protein
MAQFSTCAANLAFVGKAKKDKSKDSNAVALGRKGGLRRSEVLSPEQRSEIAEKGGRIGGKARANALTEKRRKEIARKAAEARWAKKKQN